MAERLKDAFGPEVPRRLADQVQAVHPQFPRDEFLARSLTDYETLELLPRSRHIADALAACLPQHRVDAIAILQESLPSEAVAVGWQGMDGFQLMPHVVFVGRYGLDCFEESMAFQYALTRRFTAEFSIRAFIEAHYEATMQRLGEWVLDDNEHVRRLVSEGTRPRLPWAARLNRFVTDPTPILPLLEQLKDDPSEYVRRSVANNLNDIAKDHPDVTLAVARAWSGPNAPPQRRALVRHALRTLVKRGDPQALSLLGFEAANSAATIESVVIEPRVVPIGAKVAIRVAVKNPATGPAAALVDIAIDFVKASGVPNRKVFKGAERLLAPGESAEIRKTISVAQHTTRRHYPGVHAVAVLLNGTVMPAGEFTVID